MSRDLVAADARRSGGCFALRTSQWYAQQGYLHEALRHAVSAGDWPRVADLLEPAHAVIWSSHEHARLRRWLEQLPVEVVRSRLRLCLAYTRIGK
jgi:ATP/maltotriose-dependent transcriptional regulator MalT